MYAIIGIAFCVLLGISIKAHGIVALLWFPLGFIFGLFITAQVVLPIIMGLPRAIRLILSREMRAVVIGRILITPIIWLVVLFLFGVFCPSAAGYLSNNSPLNIGLWVGTITIILSPLSANSRAAFRDDFDNAYQKFYTHLCPSSLTPVTPTLASGESQQSDMSAQMFSKKLRPPLDLAQCQEIVSSFSDLMDAHTPLIGDCALLPYPKAKILYAIKFVVDDFETKLASATDTRFVESYKNIIPSLNYIFTCLARDWHEIAPEDKEAIARLKEYDSFPEWAFYLKNKYINEDRAREEALNAATQVMKDKVGRENAELN
jgi:hypothetical protein